MESAAVVLTGGVPAAIVTALPEAISLPDTGPDDAGWVARTAIAITAAVTEAGATASLLVLAGDRCRHAPNLGFAQRAARRGVLGYVLIDPVLPAPGSVSDWPDAPVTVILAAEDAALERDARLRGWDVLIGNPPDVISGLVDLR